ncbi:MAG TPA: cytochrome c biogenesis protein CcsA, partial [Ktedonobacteraceae bacterium]|nr:cytochrome c biogenesis protein CcsA [Ktedonobacteraceae bacterium]
MALANKVAPAARSSADEPGGRLGKPRLPLVSLILWAITLVGMVLTLWLAFFYAPTDAVEGQPQRIFYVHVPISWIGMLAFVVMAVAGAVYLKTKDERWDWVARSAAEIGTV